MIISITLQFETEIDPELLSASTRARVGKAQNEKLYPYLGRHENKFFHIAHLKTWVELGVEIEDVHYLVEVEQAACMHDYILELGRRRAACTDKLVINT